MKKYRYNTAAFFAITLLTISSTIFAAEATKEYHKEFTAGQNTTLDINSKFGNVVIESWNENRIVIDVKITVNAPNNSTAEQTLSNIDVVFSERGDIIKAVTELNSRYFRNNIRGVSYSVNYTIKMPVYTALNLVNHHGNTTINELSGLVNLDVGFGNLEAGKLTRGNEKPWNNISLKHGKGYIDEAGWLTLKIDFAGMFEINKCTAVLLNSQHSKINFEEVSSVVGENSFGSITIGNINNLDLENKHSNINIETLANSLTFKTDFGGLTVDYITNGFEFIDIKSNHANIRLGIDDNASYELNGSARYGGIKYNENNFNIRQRIQQNNSLTIAGTMGNEASPKSTVKIDASHSTVTLIK